MRDQMISIEAEQAVLGGLMLSNGMWGAVAAVIGERDFAGAVHRLLFQTMSSLASAEQPLDLITISESLESAGKLAQVGGDAYLVELSNNTPSSANVVAYAHIVRQRSIERHAIQVLTDAIGVISDRTAGDVHQRIGQVESLLSALNGRTMKTEGLRHVRDIGGEWVEQVSSQVEGGVRGFTLGVDALDCLLYPKRVPAGSLVVVGARPKMGKTATMGHILKHFAVNRKEAVACFSLEMPDQQIYERLIVGASGVNPEIFYRAANDVDDWSRVNAAVKSFNDSLLYVDDTSGVRLSHIQREVRRLNKQQPVSLVAVDYLTLMEAENAERNDLAYGRVTKGLKNLAKEINGVVLMLTQLNRDLERRPDKRPHPSDSRDTGQIEQDCDVWIGLYREGGYTDHPDDDRTELIVRMNRHGRTGTVFVKQENGVIVETDDQAARDSTKQAGKPRGISGYTKTKNGE